MSKKRRGRNRDKEQLNRMVCILTKGENAGLVAENCDNHRHELRAVAERMNADGELIFLDQWLNRAVDFGEDGKPLKVANDSTPCVITANDSFRNSVGAKFEPRHPAVKAAQRKIKAWPFVGDSKAVRVGVRI